MVSCSSCCLSAAWSPESLSSEELLEDPTMPSTLSLSLSLSNSGFESEASGMFVCFSSQLKSKSYCQYEPSQPSLSHLSSHKESTPLPLTNSTHSPHEHFARLIPCESIPIILTVVENVQWSYDKRICVIVHIAEIELCAGLMISYFSAGVILNWQSRVLKQNMERPTREMMFDIIVKLTMMLQLYGRKYLLRTTAG